MPLPEARGALGSAFTQTPPGAHLRGAGRLQPQPALSPAATHQDNTSASQGAVSSCKRLGHPSEQEGDRATWTSQGPGEGVTP